MSYARRIVSKLLNEGYLKWMPDKMYLKLLWRARMHSKLNINDPKTFNEKLQWLKLYDRKPEYTLMVDKYEAKKYVAEHIGEQYIIPTIGVWDHFDDINFEQLPDQFVLKCTHDSGGLVVCRDKSKLDIDAARKKIENSLRRNFFWYGREWPYKNIRPRIIAEKYMEDDATVTENRDSLNKELIDYKFYCFSGEPKFLYVSEGLENHETAKISFIDLDWKFAPFHRNDYYTFDKLPKKPKSFDKMVQLSKKLSKGIPFIRVDLYEINGVIYFGELTFTPCSGLMLFSPQEWDYRIGQYLKLN